MKSKVNISPIESNPLLGAMFKKAGIEEGPKKSWGDLDAIYRAIGMSLIDLGNSINQAIRQLDLTLISNPDEIRLTVDGLRVDLENMTQTLVAIKSRYNGKNGFITTEEDNLLCIDCFSDYQALADRHRSLTFQPLMTITEALADIAAIQKQRAAAEAVKFTESGDIVGEAIVVKE